MRRLNYGKYDKLITAKTDNNESTSVSTNNLFKFRQLSTNDPIGLAKTIPGTNKKNEYNPM